jgi:hypothetical protein
LLIRKSNYYEKCIHYVGCIALIQFSNAQLTDADVPQKNKNGHQLSVLFGLNQPIVFRGFNFEINYWTRKWVVDYSHGFGLHDDGNIIGGEYNVQKLNFKIAHSLGAGIGYRFTKAFNLRFEPKVHIYETYYQGQEQIKRNSIANFTTYTLGFGAYYRWMPFEKNKTFLRGFTIAPSVRYWYKVGSTLHNNRFSYFNSSLNQTEAFKAPNIGIANTPLFANVSIGYTF